MWLSYTLTSSTTNALFAVIHVNVRVTQIVDIAINYLKENDSYLQVAVHVCQCLHDGLPWPLHLPVHLSQIRGMSYNYS